MHTTLTRFLTGVAAVFIAVPAVPAAAQQQQPGDVTWAVVPSAANGPDGRRVVDLELEGGQTVTEHVAVTNHSARPVDFTLDANDGYLTDKGVFDMRSADVAPVDGGSWIALADKVTVAGGATTVVPVTISAPAQATPGDHPAGVTASLDTVEGQVRVQNRVGVRFNIRVTGALTAQLAVNDVQASYEASWNPFASGTMRLQYKVSNEGNTRTAADVRVTNSTLIADTEWTDTGTARSREVLPGGMRQFDSRTGAWPFGQITTTITVTPGPVDGGPAVGGATPVTVTVTTWALPIPQVLLLVLVLLVAFTVRAVVRARRRRLERLLAAARDEGRAEAASV